MMSYVLSLQRAPWKARVLCGIWMVFAADNVWVDSARLLHGPTFTSVIGSAANLAMVWMTFLVCVLGRVPRFWSRNTGSLNRTLPQIYGDIAAQNRDEQERSKRL